MRRRVFAVIVLVFFSATSLSQGQSSEDYVSEASRVVGTYEPQSRDHSPQAMAEAAQAFLQTLDAEQRERVSLPLTDPERREWTNLPARADAGGLRLGDCNEEQVEAACDLMASLLSHQGYAKMCSIMLADDQLLEGGRRRQGIGTEDFAVVLFGDPSPEGPWAFQLDGHHVGLNLAIDGSNLTLSPSFIGTQPEAFHIADTHYRPLAGEIDGAYKLVNSLDDEQRSQAIVSSKRGRMKAGPGNDGKTLEPEGVSCAGFSKEQRDMLLALVAEWVNVLPNQQAKLRLQQLEEELSEMHFAWNGPTEPKSDISYTIQGPTLIIEYTCQDLGGNPPDHLHTIYRNPTNEYGGQLDD